MANKEQVERAVEARRYATGRPMSESAMERISESSVRLRPREEMRLVARPTNEDRAKAREDGVSYVRPEIHTLNFYNVDGEAVLASVYCHIVFYGRGGTPAETEESLCYHSDSLGNGKENPMGRKAYERGLELIAELQRAVDEAGMGGYPSEAESEVAKLDADIRNSNMASAKITEARRYVLDLSTEFISYDEREELAVALADAESELQDYRASANSRVAATMTGRG